MLERLRESRDVNHTSSSSSQIAMVYSTTEEHLTVIPGTHLYWLGGAPPPDFPVCGFKNDNQVCLASQYAKDQSEVKVHMHWFL